MTKELEFITLQKAAKKEIQKGKMKLSFDYESQMILVADIKNNLESYTVSQDNKEMVTQTLLYFGIKKETDNYEKPKNIPFLKRIFKRN